MLSAYKHHFATILASHLDMSVDTITSMIARAPENIEWDLAFPCFTLAKTLKKAPNMIAADLAQKIADSEKGQSFFSAFVAVWPYVNAVIDHLPLARETLAHIQESKDNYGQGNAKGETWLVEWRSPNTHKVLHVGHLRNAMMSESVCTLLQKAGYDVIRTAYGGDIGAHVAKWIWYYAHFTDQQHPTDPEEFCIWAWDIYAASERKLKEDEARYKPEIDEVQHKLENGDQELVDLRKKTRELSIAWVNKVFAELGCRIQREYFESEVEQPGIEIVKKLVQDETIPEIKESQGAIIADLEKYDLGTFVLLKSNGTSLYSTKDIALVDLKKQEYRFDKSLYIVASEQNRHFKQLFKTLELMGEDTSSLHHLWYELLVLPEGKMSSRKGTVIRYHDLRTQSIAKARDLIADRDLSDQEKDDIARHVAFGAMKFAILLVDAYKTLVFDMERSLSFEGETWPYIMYTHARCCSIIKKATINTDADLSLLTTPQEKKLIIHLAQFPETIQHAADNIAPHEIARYVLDLASLFNAFYAKNKVISDDKKLSDARLVLVDAVRQTLANGCRMLGIEPVEKM